jgi:hypothetical protein
MTDDGINWQPLPPDTETPPPVAPPPIEAKGDDWAGWQLVPLPPSTQPQMGAPQSILDRLSRSQFAKDIENAGMTLVLLVLVLLVFGVGARWIWSSFGATNWSRLAVNVRRGLLRLYLAITVLWISWFGYRIHYDSTYSYYSEGTLESDIVKLLTFPLGAIILFLVGGWIVDGFRKQSPVITKSANSGNVRRNLLRLYFVITVLWISWFGYRIHYDSTYPYYSEGTLESDIVKLLTFPLGAIILFLVGGWIVDGFRKHRRVPNQRIPKAIKEWRQIKLHPLAISHQYLRRNCQVVADYQSASDYQTAIERAVFELVDNTPETRQALYERTRAALASQLSSQDLPSSHIARQKHLLNAAIRSTEASISSGMKLARKGSTALLFLSIF